MPTQKVGTYYALHSRVIYLTMLHMVLAELAAEMLLKNNLGCNILQSKTGTEPQVGSKDDLNKRASNMFISGVCYT